MLDSVILIFMCIVVVFGSLVIYFEDYSPNVLNRLLMYGAFGHRGPGNKIWNYIEIPMAHYRDFYVFATFFNVLSLIYMASVYFLEWEVNELIFRTLKLLCSRSESVSMASAITTVLLFTLQCLRRLYETFYIQVFSESAKMNILHFVMAITHYFICVIAFGVGSAPLFSGKQTRDSMPWIDTYTKYVAAPCIVVFIMSWYEQYRTNIILANLRKDKKTGEVVSMGYRVPHGRLFEYTSSPHRLCEIFIYVALAVLKPTTTNIYICIWVFSNQLQAAVAAHKWYIKTFKNYPSNRTALIPFLF